MPTRKRVLHVDDDPDVREVVAITFELASEIEIAQFSSGPEVLESAADLHADLLLFDVMMPDMSGLELLNRLREEGKFLDVPAVFLTAKASEHDLAALLENGAHKVITKPFDPLSLVDQVTQIIEDCADQKDADQEPSAAAAI